MPGNRSQRPLHSLVGGLIVVVLVFAFVPMGLAAGITFCAFLVALGWSAIKYREKGWVVGLVFVALTLTIPLWVMLAFKLCENLGLFGP
jgi:hypothetical protein